MEKEILEKVAMMEIKFLEMDVVVPALKKMGGLVVEEVQ